MHSRTEKKRNPTKDNDKHSSFRDSVMIWSSSTMSMPQNSRLSMESVNTSMHAYRTCHGMDVHCIRQERGSHWRHGYCFETSQVRDRLCLVRYSDHGLTQPRWGYFGRLYLYEKWITTTLSVIGSIPPEAKMIPRPATTTRFTATPLSFKFSLTS